MSVFAFRFAALIFMVASLLSMWDGEFSDSALLLMILCIVAANRADLIRLVGDE